MRGSTESRWGPPALARETPVLYPSARQAMLILQAGPNKSKRDSNQKKEEVNKQTTRNQKRDLPHDYTNKGWPIQRADVRSAVLGTSIHFRRHGWCARGFGERVGGEGAAHRLAFEKPMPSDGATCHGAPCPRQSRGRRPPVIPVSRQQRGRGQQGQEGRRSKGGAGTCAVV